MSTWDMLESLACQTTPLSDYQYVTLKPLDLHLIAFLLVVTSLHDSVLAHSPSLLTQEWRMKRCGVDLPIRTTSRLILLANQVGAFRGYAPSPGSLRDADSSESRVRIPHKPLGGFSG